MQLSAKLKQANKNITELEINRIIDEIFSKVTQYKKPEELVNIYNIFSEYSEKYHLQLTLAKLHSPYQGFLSSITLYFI